MIGTSPARCLARDSTPEIRTPPRRSRPPPEPVGGYLDLDLPKSPPRLHEISRVLRRLRIHAASCRTRVNGERLAVCLEIAEWDGSALSETRVAHLESALKSEGFRAASAFDSGLPTKSGVHSLLQLDA